MKRFCTTVLAITVIVLCVAMPSMASSNPLVRARNSNTEIATNPMLTGGSTATAISKTSMSVRVWLQGRIASFRYWYIPHREKVVAATQWAREAGASEPYSLALLLLAGSILLWGRERRKQLGTLFSSLIAKWPVSAWRGGGVKDEQIAIVRELLFYSLAYVTYEIVSRLLAFKNATDISFYSDFIFRLFLIIQLLRAHRRLQHNVAGQNTLRAEKKIRLQKFYDDHFKEWNISTSIIRRTAIGVFVLTFAPSAIFHLPQILDYLVSV